MPPVDGHDDRPGSPPWVWAALVALALATLTAGAIVGMVTTDDRDGSTASQRHRRRGCAGRSPCRRSRPTSYRPPCPFRRSRRCPPTRASPSRPCRAPRPRPTARRFPRAPARGRQASRATQSSWPRSPRRRAVRRPTAPPSAPPRPGCPRWASSARPTSRACGQAGGSCTAASTAPTRRPAPRCLRLRPLDSRRPTPAASLRNAT